MASQDEILQQAQAKLLRLRDSAPTPMPRPQNAPIEQYTPEFRPEPPNYVLKAEDLAKPPYYSHPDDLRNRMPTGPEQAGAGATGQTVLPKALGLHPDLDEEIAAEQEGNLPAPSMADVIASVNPEEQMSRPPIGSGALLKKTLADPAAGAVDVPDAGATEAGAAPTSREAMVEAIDLWDRNNQFDYSGMEAVEKQRRADARSDAQGGMLMSTFGGSRLAPRGGELFRKSLASKPLRPNAADLGYFDPEGNYVENPDNAKRAQQKVFMDMINADDKMAANNARLAEAEARRLETAGQREEANAIRRESIAAQDRRQKDRLAQTKEIAKWMEEGRMARYKPESAAERRFKLDNKTNLNQAKAALQKVIANPDAFGKKTYLPGDVTQRLPWKGYGDEASVKARAAIANIVSMEIKMRSGAAVTAAEMPRLKPFLPVDGDKPETVIWKIEGLIEEYQRILDEIEADIPESEIINRAKPVTGEDAEGWTIEEVD